MNRDTPRSYLKTRYIKIMLARAHGNMTTAKDIKKLLAKGVKSWKLNQIGNNQYKMKKQNRLSVAILIIRLNFMAFYIISPMIF